MKKGQLTIVILNLFLTTFHLSGQDFKDLPILKPSNISAFDIDAGLPISCTFNAMYDKKGRLWINPCYIQEEHKTINFYHYNGKTAQVINWDSLPPNVNGQTALSGLTEEGIFYGYFRETDGFFLFNPDTHQTQFFTLGNKQAAIRYMGMDGQGQLIIYALSNDHYFIYRLEKGQPRQLVSVPSDSTNLGFADHDFYYARKYIETCLVSGNAFWFLKGIQPPDSSEKRLSTLTLTKVDLSTGKVSDFSASFFLKKNTLFNGLLDLNLPTSKISIDADGNILLLLLPWSKIFVLDPNTEKFKSKPFFPVEEKEVDYTNEQPVLAKDSKGNFLYFFRTKEKKYWAILLDNTGKYFNYSQVLNDAIAQTRYKSGPISDVLGSDFKEKIAVFTAGGLAVASLQLSNAITIYFENYATRAILETSPHKFVISPSGLGPGIIILEPGIQPPGSISPFIPKYPGKKSFIDEANIRKDSKGNCYLPTSLKHKELVKVSPDGKWVEYDVNATFSKFNLLNDHTIVLASDRQLFSYDLNSRQLSPIIADGKPFSIAANQINEIFTATDGTVWIASLEGLWQVDIKAGKSRRFGLKDGFRDKRMMCIHEDERGRLWIGTYSGGLHIFDPETGRLSVVDESNGLSNNTVIGILEDSEGVCWLATYNGITLVSPEGNILSRLYKEDGLSTNEFNRYSYYKDSEGKLLFGSVAGINIIDPEAVKKQILKTQDLNIYLTGISFFDKKSNADVTLKYGFDPSTELHLDAAHRYLKIDFALTSMVRSGENNFSYKIESPNHRNDSWSFIGSNTQLNLYNLPAGQFNILIRGRNYRGNWTLNPIVISVDAGEFFYKEPWFYGILFLFFAGLTAAWVIRNMKERERLQKMVVERTKRITEDKQVIEEQTLKLKELDQAKTRFFTNISHEFRTPLTVISGMAQQIKEFPNQWTAKGIELIQRNCDELLSLINQILDLRKLESGTYKINLVQKNIVPYLHYIVESFIQIAKSKGISIHFISNIPELYMDFDPEKMMHILSNLISNAIKFTPDHGNIYILIDSHKAIEREELEIQVKDTGKGISGEALPYIFNLFYQVEDLASQKPMGSGIGLSLVNELVTKMGGTIKAESITGEGSIFILRFPVTQNQPIQESINFFPEKMDGESATAVSIKENEHSAKGLGELNYEVELSEDTIGQNELPVLLVVEDNQDVLEYLSSCLINEYQLIFATNGQQGIDKAIEYVPDLIVSDVMMPVKDGFMLCDTLKTDLRTSHIPIVLLTAKADQKSKIDGLTKGADAYLTKPFQKEELLLTLKNLLKLRDRLQQRYQNLDTIVVSPSEEYILEDKFIQQLRESVMTNITDEEWGVQELCMELAISRTQLHNKIKALTGKSTTHLIRSIRLFRAKELLQSTDLNVSEISYEIGIGNPAYFSRIYTEEFGESPSKTRKQ